MLSSLAVKKIVTEARPIIERQLNDALKLAGMREVVAKAGGDWGQLKALIKAQIQDENDDAGDRKHVKKILDKAGYATAYADMLGLNMNEKNFSERTEPDRDERRRQRFSESMEDTKEFSAEAVADGLISPEAHAETVRLSDALATKFGNGPLPPHDETTGEVFEDDTQESQDGAAALTSPPAVSTPSLTGMEGDIGRSPIHEPEAPKPLPDVADDFAAAIAQPVEAKTFVQEALTNASGVMQDECAIHLPTNSEPEPETARQPEPSVTGADADVAAPSSGEQSGMAGQGKPESDRLKSEPLLSAPAPGVVYYETCPPVGVIHHEFDKCFPQIFGLRLQVIAKDIEANGVREPIVKIGDYILDGWARYCSARDLEIEYPVMQYDGTDPLADCIRWNLQGSRMLTMAERKTVATKLAKLPGNEGRANEIAELFGIEMAVA